MPKPKLPTDVDALIGIYQAAVADVPEGYNAAEVAARTILSRFEPHPHQVERWIPLGLAAEIASAMEDREDDDE